MKILSICLLSTLSLCSGIANAAVEVSAAASAPGDVVRITSDDGRFAGYNNIGVYQMFNGGNSMWWLSVGEWVWSEDGRQIAFTVPSNVLPGTYGLSVFNYRRSVNEKFGTFTITGGSPRGAVIGNVTPDPAYRSSRVTLKGSGLSKVRNEITLKPSPYDGQGYYAFVSASYDGESLEFFVPDKIAFGNYTISVFNGVMDGNIAAISIQPVQVGTVTTYLSEYDPNASQTREAGTRRYRFSGIKTIIGSAERGILSKVTFTQNGTAAADDLENVEIVVRGKSYTPIIQLNRYTADFGHDIVTGTGFSEDVYIQGDLKSSSAGKTVRMDIRDSSDIRFVGETSGEVLKVYEGTSPNLAQYFTGGTPWFKGNTLTVEPNHTSSPSGGSGGVGSGGGGGGGQGATPVVPSVSEPEPLPVNIADEYNVYRVVFGTGICVFFTEKPLPVDVTIDLVVDNNHWQFESEDERFVAHNEERTLFAVIASSPSFQEFLQSGGARLRVQIFR